MRKKIGIVFPPTSAGGVHQYALSIAQSLITHVGELDYAIIHDVGEPPELFGIPAGTRVDFIERVNPNLGPEIHPLRKILHFIGAATDCMRLLIRSLPAVTARADIHLLIFPTPLTYDLPIDLPYVATIPDVQHRYMPNAPDYGWALVKKRDIIYGWFARHSLLNTADSEQGRDDLRRFLRVPASKTRVIPYIATNYIYELRGMSRDQARALLDRYDLPERFVFYPAQFWYQKNHDRLIRALNAVRERHGVRIPLVAVGNGAGRFAEVFETVRATVRALGMEDMFLHLGYVSNREMVALYRTTVALVAPALQGPTTLPPIEALLLGTPIATVRLYDVPKQVGEAALLFDPYDVDDMAAQIYRVWSDAELRASLVAKGNERARAYLPERFAAQWRELIRDAFRLIP